MVIAVGKKMPLSGRNARYRACWPQGGGAGGMMGDYNGFSIFTPGDPNIRSPSIGGTKCQYALLTSFPHFAHFIVPLHIRKKVTEPQLH